MLTPLGATEVLDIFDINLKGVLPFLKKGPFSSFIQSPVVLHGQVTSWDWDNYLLCVQPIASENVSDSVIVHVRTSEYEKLDFFRGMEIITIGKLCHQKNESRDWLELPMATLRGGCGPIENFFTMESGMIHGKNILKSLNLI